MEQRLQNLESLARGLDPGAEPRVELWAGARGYAEAFLEALERVTKTAAQL